MFHRSRFRTARLAAAATLCALTLTACGGSGEEADTGLRPLGDANTELKTTRPAEPARLAVTGVRIGHHKRFDRVVFDLAGEGRPGWHVTYRQNPTSQASGSTVSFEGDVALDVNIDGTVYPFELDLEDPHLGTTEGPGRSVVSSVTPVGTMEGRSQFVVGLKKEVPYSVQVLSGPTRLVVDLVRN